MEADFIKKTIEGIIENFPVKTYFKEVSALPGGDILRFDLATEEDPRSLIGIDGQNLLALNHLVKKIYEKQREKNSWRVAGCIRAFLRSMGEKCQNRLTIL